MTTRNTLSSATEAANLVPDRPAPTPNYWCTWAVQNYMHGQGLKELDPAVLEGQSGADFGKANISEQTMLGDKGWIASFYPRARADLFLVLDDGWDVPVKDPGPWYSSFLLNDGKFPSLAALTPGQRLKKLNEAAKAAGWRGIGLWLAAQESTATTPVAPSAMEYWRWRMRWCREAGVEYWKVDWGHKSEDNAFRKMLTDVGRQEYPNLIIEHAVGHGPFNETPRVAEAWTTECANRAAYSDVMRLYDLSPQLSVPAMLDRVAQVLKVATKPQAPTMGLLNCDDEPIIAAVLGVAMGVLRHPMTGLRPGADPDVFFSGPRQQKKRMDEVTRAVRWHRFAPAFASAGAETSLDDELLTDNWFFRRGDFWSGIGKLINQSAPARVSRGLPLPEVVSAGEAPYVIASRHPNGAVAVGTLGRIDREKGWSEPRADVTLRIGAIPPAIGIFGHYRSLTLLFDKPLPKGQILAQDLAGDKAQDITVQVKLNANSLQISGELIDKIGLSAASPGDVSGPGLVLVLPGRVPVKIEKIEPTPIFPRPADGQPLKQKVNLHLTNVGPARAVAARITVGAAAPYVEELGTLVPGQSVVPIHVLDIAAPTTLVVEVFSSDDPPFVTRREEAWLPHKKWRIHCVSFSHWDNGFGDNPHRLRTNIRHENISRALQFCRETDGWDADSRFRYQLETAEPLTSFLDSVSPDTRDELARRIREGRISVAALHGSDCIEHFSHEMMARQFYMANRHGRDLLDIPFQKCGQNDDVVGLPWPLFTFYKESGIPYFYHGFNWYCGPGPVLGLTHPLFYWQGCDGDEKNKTLVHAWQYCWNPLGGSKEENILNIVNALAPMHEGYDVLLSQNVGDFSYINKSNATSVHEWNARYAFPRLISSTMDAYMEDLVTHADLSKVPTFAKDHANNWADQHATFANMLALARRQTDLIPTAEKFATIASVIAGGGYPWLDVWQAYNRLLLYFEHTASSTELFGMEKEHACQYETEKAEHLEEVEMAQTCASNATEFAFGQLCHLIRTDKEKTLAIFNPMSWPRTDVVRTPAPELAEPFRLVDGITGREVPLQRMDDGTVVFIASDVPPMGYKTFRAEPGRQAAAADTLVARDNVLENRFYRILFDAATGGISSIVDKELKVELVDQAAPQKFNQYLYERYRTTELKDGTEWFEAGNAALSSTRGPVAAIMTSTASARGVERLVRRVTIYEDIKRIDFTMDLDKSPSGRDLEDYRSKNFRAREAVFAALPLAVKDFSIHHDLPGAVIDPYRQQGEGACTSFFGVRHFTDLSNDRFGVTLATVESPLVQYGRVRSCPYDDGSGQRNYENDLTYPDNSRVYLYLMNNMFVCNIGISQPGPAQFSWSIRSHEGDWRNGQANRFGWDINNPLIARFISGAQTGPLPAARHSFLTIDQPNVICTTIKPAEANGRGLILRFNEAEGTASTVTVALPFFGRIAEANETSVIEDDRATPVTVLADSQIRFDIRPFGVKTIRIVSPARVPQAAGRLRAEAVSDMQVDLTWDIHPSAAEQVDHYDIHRDTREDFTPSLLNRVAQAAGTTHRDEPELHPAGWFSNRLTPDTTYYYRIVAVDRWNNSGLASGTVSARTLRSSVRNAAPAQVQGLKVIPVSDVAPQYNYLNLLFLNNVESDVSGYIIHRGEVAGFIPSASSDIGTVAVDSIIKGEEKYGHIPTDHRVGDYDHVMYADETVRPGTTYYYRVCAVDQSGQHGPFSEEASGRTRP